MPEISARDLRRLEALEGRLLKTQDERKALAAERRELRSAVTANAQRARAAEREAASAGEKLEAVLAENSALAARVDEITDDVDRLRAASLDLRQELDAARAELTQAQETLAKAESELAAALAERDRLAESLNLAQEQLAGKSLTPVLPAKDVAKLLEGFVADLGSGLPGMAVHDGEVRLRVAFGKVGRLTGFVVPSAESPPEISNNLHEVAIRFERTIELPNR